MYGPVPVNTIWAGFGGGCQNNNDGDPTVVYDRLAHRWVISEFSVSSKPYLQCVAVSMTEDAAGAYARYSFRYANFPDYPKMGVWPDAYYVTYNMFQNGQTFVGATTCALNRVAMLASQPATQVCFDTGAFYGGLLPSDLDGATPPPAGSPGYVIALAATSTAKLALWKFHVDFATPGNSTFGVGSGHAPVEFDVPAYAEACAGACIPQKPGTGGGRLDSWRTG